MYIVYKTTNTITGHYYIGTHKLPKNINKDTYLGSGKELKKQLEAYPREIFVRNILFEFESSNDAFNMEHELIQQCRNDSLCLNRSHGGRNFDYINETKLNVSTQAYRKATQQFQELMKDLDYAKEFSEKVKAGFTDEVRAHISEVNKGKAFFAGHKHTDDTKRKMSLKASKRIGSKNSQYGSFWITNDEINKKWKDEYGKIPDGFHKGRIMK